MTLAAASTASGRTLRLWAELCALFAGVPLALAFLVPPDAVWTVAGAALALGLVLLARTPGFAWRELRAGPWVGDLRLLLGFTAATAAVAVGLVLWLAPGGLFGLAARQTGLWLAVMLLYPLFSALPQEVLFRVLFFRRYGALFPNRTIAVAVNAAFFGLAHLFLWNWVAVGMSVVGGAVFAHAYLGRDETPNFRFALLLHVVAGWIVFTAGLGLFFYHGAI